MIIIAVTIDTNLHTTVATVVALLTIVKSEEDH
jgi:hypothetical protein